MIRLERRLVGVTPPLVGLACVLVCLFGGLRVAEVTCKYWRSRRKGMKMAPIKQTTRSGHAQQRAVQAKTSLPAPSNTAMFKANLRPPTGRGEVSKTEQRKSATSRCLKAKLYIAPDTAKYLASLTPPPKQEAEIPPLLRTLYRALARCAEPGD
jgi:hypothetical protein